METMKALLQKIAEDSMLQAKFNAVMNNVENDQETAAAEKLEALIKEAGFDITLEELYGFFKTEAEQNQELSCDKLDLVSGGTGFDENISFDMFQLVQQILLKLRQIEQARTDTMNGIARP